MLNCWCITWPVGFKRLNYIWRFSSYRAVNILRLGYYNQSVNVVYKNNRYWLWGPYTHSVEKRRIFLKKSLVVCNVTNRLQRTCRWISCFEELKMTSLNSTACWVIKWPHSIDTKTSTQLVTDAGLSLKVISHILSPCTLALQTVTMRNAPYCAPEVGGLTTRYQCGLGLLYNINKMGLAALCNACYRPLDLILYQC